MNEIRIKAICKDGTIWFCPDSKVILDFEVNDSSNRHALASMINEMGLQKYPLANNDENPRLDTRITEDELLVWVNEDMVIIESESPDYEKGDTIQEFELEDYNNYTI